MRKLLTFFTTIVLLWFCAARVSAQELVTLPSGGPHKLGTALDRLGNYDALSVTYSPPHVVLFLDGAPLKLYAPLTPEQAQRVMVFSAKKNGGVPLGVAPLYSAPKNDSRKPRIRCINPRF